MNRPDTARLNSVLDSIDEQGKQMDKFLDSPDITKQDVIDMSEAVNQAAKELDDLNNLLKGKNNEYTKELELI